MKNLGILGSTRGTVMLSLIDAIQQKKLNANISVVVSNKSDAPILTRAKQYGILSHFINPKNLTHEEYDQNLSKLFNLHNIDLIVLIGYMKILSQNFVHEWKNKIINIHPSLLPNFAGMMDMKIHEAVLNSKINETGCTVHYVSEEVDAGQILLQKKCPVFPTDTKEILKSRVQALEAESLIEIINQI